MKFLLDTHVLIWAFADPMRLSAATRDLLEDGNHEPVFSVISLWEIGVKRGLNRPDFSFDAQLLRGSAIAVGYTELALEGSHVLGIDQLGIDQLPPLHRDPYDRLLVCQAMVEGMTILTKDSRLLEYPVSARRA